VKQIPKFLILITIIQICQRSAADQIKFNEISLSGFEQEISILNVEDAFRFGSYLENSTLNIFWDVMPGYFLYRDKVEVWQDGRSRTVILPDGSPLFDEVFGEVLVMDGLIELQISWSESEDVEVRYQGCAESGYCYPPQKKTINSANYDLNSKKSSIFSIY